MGYVQKRVARNRTHLQTTFQSSCCLLDDVLRNNPLT